MKKGIIWGSLLVALLLSIQLASFALQVFGGDDTPVFWKEDRLAPVAFREVWGYLIRGDEKSFTNDLPVTDVCYFSCGVNSKGRINMKVSRPRIPDLNGKKRRVHIVISELQNSSLMHYALNPKYNIRDYLIDDIIEVSKKFDGVQIDFESIYPEDAANFHKFLAVIKMGLDQGKIFSVALPPRKGKIANDAFDYETVAGIADRVYIMAYDEHWSTSDPGPVASLSWCRDIVNHAGDIIDPEKLIMGIPFYGRAWSDRSRSRSIQSRQIPGILAKDEITYEYSADTGFRITYKDSGNIVLYYDDINATKEKFRLYRKYSDSVGFWRLGMETPEIWKEIKLRE